MTEDKFLRTVWSMREAQKEYFKKRSMAALKESKRLEGVVDREIKRRFDAMNGDLFNQ